MKYFLLPFVSLFALAIPFAASAAVLSLAPATSTLAAGQEVQIKLLLRSDTAINTVGTAVILPAGLEFVSAQKGPIIQDWVDTPAYSSADRSVEFSGIIPDGWQGSGTMLTVTARADEAGTYSLRYDPSQTEVYRNDGNATPEPVVFGTISNTLETSWLIGALILAAALALLWAFLRHHAVHLRFR